MYHLALAMWPRILSTFDEDLNPIVTSVRVGQAVDVVGQAGNLIYYMVAPYSLVKQASPRRSPAL